MLDEFYINLPAGRVFAKAAGQPGDPLIFCLHGWSQKNGWHTWEPLMEPWSAAGFRVVSVDMPGWGKSDRWSKVPLMGPQAVAAVIGMLDALQAETAVLAGKSWGGGVALDTAMAHPQRISKLILTAPAFEGGLDCLTVSQPVLLTWAEDDPTIPFRVAAGYQTAIPHLEFVPYPTGLHNAAARNAADFAPKAIAFLKNEELNTD
jgi:pimeloyl-ACP methyl ester carboxylesterase